MQLNFVSCQRPVLHMVSVFASLTAEEDLAWSQQCFYAQAPAGTLLFDYSARIEYVYFTLSGRMRASLKAAPGKEFFLDEFGPGQMMGEFAAIDGQAYSASLFTVTACDLIAIPVVLFRAILAKHHDICLALFTVMVGRMRGMTMRLKELSYLDTRHRLFYALLRLSREIEGEKQQRQVVPLLTHAELGEHIGASRETVSREMSRLMQDGLIIRAENALILTNPRELHRRLARVVEPERCYEDMVQKL